VLAGPAFSKLAFRAVAAFTLNVRILGYEAVIEARSPPRGDLFSVGIQRQGGRRKSRRFQRLECNSIPVGELQLLHRIRDRKSGNLPLPDQRPDHRPLAVPVAT